jgi:ATP-dependent DNA ligase
VLDGQVVCLDCDSRPQFYVLLRRRGDGHFVAFDILDLDGHDLRNLPLWRRKAVLRGVLPDGGPVLYARHIQGNGTKLFALACALDLEGVVAKWTKGVYLDGATGRTSWVKIENSKYSQMIGRDKLLKKRSRAQNA